jgi:hypothetical protein
MIPAEENVPVVETVDAESAYEAIIPSYTAQKLAAGEVNGHSYVYIVFKGSRLFVYDLDTDELIDNVLLGTMSHPRCIYVDHDGIVWVGGSGSKLFRYDPYTKAGNEIKIPYSTLFPKVSSGNILGLTGDENGNLYFGTYNAGYLGMYDTKTETFSCLSDGMLGEDAMYSGWGGVHVKDGFAYLCINGDKNNDNVQTHELLKFNLSTGNIDARRDIADRMGTTKYLSGLNMIGDLLIASVADQMIVVDTNTMTEATFEGLEHRFFGQISKEINGKYYLMDRGEAGDFGRGLLEYDLAAGTLTPVCTTAVGSFVGSQCAVTMDVLPGVSLVTYRIADNGVNLTVYNPESGETLIVENVTDSQGCGNVTRSLTSTPDGKTVFVGAYGINKLAIYDVATGDRTGLFDTYSHQTEGLLWYRDNLYIGNYNQGVITKFDINTGTATPLMVLDSTTAFAQVRMNAMAAGDGMVFVGTAPDQYRLGGVLTWFSMEEDRVYVAAGPNPEDVYYTAAGLLDAQGNQITQEWYSVATGQPAAFDEDGDGKDDCYITINEDKNGDGKNDSVQRFTGVIKNQSINAMVYQNGYIIGSTTQAGGSGSEAIESVNACLFVYDVKNMRLVKTLDLAEAIPDLTTPVPFGDAIAADPEVTGKFWGVVSDTLFSFTFDFENEQFSVTEELSLGKEKYNHGNNMWQSRNIVFDGDFMYVVFGTYGTYMVNRENPSFRVQLSAAVPNQMALGADGNLYFYNNDNTLDLQVLKIGEAVQPILDPYEAADAQGMIDALDDAANITLEDEISVQAARTAYNALSEGGKEMVNADKLLAAEAVIAPLRAAADKVAADGVVAKIDAIGTVTLESEEAIKAARTAYVALTADQKKLVETAKLEVAETKLAELKAAAEKEAADKAAADPVIAQIDAIGTVTLESEEAIQTARAAYESLTTDQKKLVDTAKMEAAETKLAELKVAAEKEAADKTAAAAVIVQINDIGTVTQDSEDAIKAVRAAYEALTAEQKALITNLDVLEAAENAYAALIKDPTNPGTGDSVHVMLLTVIVLISILAMAALVLPKKRRST